MRYTILAAVILAAATYGALQQIAERKVERAVGEGGYRLDERHEAEMAAFQQLESGLRELGDDAFADRLERLRGDGAIRVSPALGPERWAVFVEALRLVRRIYVRRLALVNPTAHHYPVARDDIPAFNQRTVAWISLAGALRHELAHYDGMMDEGDAYATEIAWYEGLRASPWFASLTGEKRRVFDWALQSAVLSARSAAARAGAPAAQ